MTESALDQIRKLEEERQRLLEQARVEALAKAQEGVDELNKLGFRYELRERGAKSKTGEGAPASKPDKGTRDAAE